MTSNNYKLFYLVYRDKYEQAMDTLDIRNEQLAMCTKEIGELFGKVGGRPASSPHEAWLVLDSVRGANAVLMELLNDIIDYLDRPGLEAAEWYKISPKLLGRIRAATEHVK